MGPRCLVGALLVLEAGCSSSSQAKCDGACAQEAGVDAAGSDGADAGDAADAGDDGNTLAIATASNGLIADLAVDDTSVYWLESNAMGGTSVRKAPAAGGASTELATSPASPANLVIDANNVYFTDYAGGTSTLWRVAIAGGGASMLTSFAADSTRLADLATDGQSVYWASHAAGAIRAVMVDGGAPTDVATGQAGPLALAIDADAVYWLNEGTGGVGSVMRAPKAAGPAMKLADVSVADINGAIAVNATSVYVRAGPLDAPNLIRVPLTGGAPTPLGVQADGRFAIDASWIFFTVSATAGASVDKVPLVGGAPIVLATSSDLAGSVADNRDAVYFVAGRDTLWRVGK
jgi:hypothetical protein